MTRMFLWAGLLGLFACAASASTLPGQDIKASVTASYCVQSEVAATASVDFLDHVDAPVQSTSQPTVALIERTEPLASAGPAVVFVAPEPADPVYYTTTSSLFSGPSLAGKRVKLAGRIWAHNGVVYLDDGGSVAIKDASAPSGLTYAPASVAIRPELITSMPAPGAVVVIQGVVRYEDNGQPALLPFTDSCMKTIQ